MTAPGLSIAFDPNQWYVPNSGNLRIAGNTLIFSDGIETAHHVMGLSAAAAEQHVSLRVLIRPLKEGTADICFHLFGGHKIAVLSRRGTVVHLMPGARVAVYPRSDDSFLVHAEYESSHDSILIGTSRGTATFLCRRRARAVQY